MGEESFELTLPAIPAMAAVVRRFVRGVVEYAADAAEGHQAELAVGEMANLTLATLPHGIGRATLRLHARVASGLIRFELSELGPGLADQRSPEVQAYSLALMTGHSYRWGRDVTPAGEIVRWIELPHA